jgi:hypothetical protein
MSTYITNKYFASGGYIFTRRKIISAKKVKSEKNFWGNPIIHKLKISYIGKKYKGTHHSDFSSDINLTEYQATVDYILEYSTEEDCNKALKVFQEIVEDNFKVLEK